VVAAAASLVAEGAAWQKPGFGSSSSTLGSTVAAWRRRRQCSIGGSSKALGEVLAAAAGQRSKDVSGDGLEGQAGGGGHSSPR
jgi:hypothetical protein